MIPEDTLGNPGLETEYLTSCIFSGILYPADYNTLRINFAGLKFIDATGPLLAELQFLQKTLVDKFGLMKDDPMEDFYFGDNPDLFRQMQAVDMTLEGMIPLYSMAVAEKFMGIHDNIAAKASTMSYQDLGQGVKESKLAVDEMTQLDQTHLSLRKAQGNVQAILRSYGAAQGKLPKKAKITPGLNTEYKLFLQHLPDNLEQVCNNIELGKTIGKVYDSVVSLMPKDELDPYLTDVFNNFLEVVTNPKSFYTLCQHDNVISSSVGQMFGHCYKEYYSKFVDMYMEEVDSMDYQAQLDFRKCFGLIPDNSQLTMLCSLYVKLGFKQQ